VVIAKMAGYDLGYAAGLHSGSQTISAAIGLSTDAINRVGMAPDQSKALLDSMPIAYAVTYMFGTVRSALVIAMLGPVLLRINLPAACKEYEEQQGGSAKEFGGAGSAWHRWEARAFEVLSGGRSVGMRVAEVEGLLPSERILCCAFAEPAATLKRQLQIQCSIRATSSLWWAHGKYLRS
jgi:putative transport protein